MAEVSSQRRFAVMGANLLKILTKIAKNQTICRLLKYQDENPLDESREDVNGLDLLHKQIIIVPKLPEDGIECSFIVIVFDNFTINPANPDFKLSRIRFDIVCPYSEWILDAGNLRPYLIMQEIDTLFNQSKLSGIGNLQFTHSAPLTLSPQIGGYSMFYQINEFN